MWCLGNDIILAVQYKTMHGTNNIFQTVYALKGYCIN